MRPRRILLVGYYGKGNFGDDVLLTTSYHILKKTYPDAAISVIVDGNAGEYVSAMLGDVTLLRPGRHGRFDLIVHGGGGVYFDFKPHGWSARLFERYLHAVGLPTSIAWEKSLRRLMGKARTSAPVRVGMGIGVGTYTAGSPRLRASLPILADYDALWVRDAQSVANLTRFQTVLSGDVILGSDLAFLTQHWLSKPLGQRQASTRPRLGIMLRDWPPELGGLPEATVRETLTVLAEQYDVTGFIFDRHADPQMQCLFAPYRTCIWQPETMSMMEFAAEIAQQDVLLTSRAHGAICGACVGVPSAIVAIEPKLQQVAQMLAGACHVVAADQPQNWAEALQQAHAITPQAIAAAVEKNRAVSTEALARITRWLQ